MLYSQNHININVHIHMKIHMPKQADSVVEVRTVY